MSFINKKFIMLHHLHDNNKFKRIKGSFSINKFENIVRKSNNKKILFTFDDGYRSQLIAAKILKKYNHKGIFFLNTSQLFGKINIHELSKFFIQKYFSNYKIFLKEFTKISKKSFLNNKVEKKRLKAKFPFYSDAEINLRILRNNDVLNYNNIMKKLFKQKSFNYTEFQKKIFLDRKSIIRLSQNHLIGLHTHSHPYNFDKLSYQRQYLEIKKNKLILEKLTKNKIEIFSFPVGNFNKNTIRVLKKLKIKFSFINNDKKLKSNSNYFLPRININKYNNAY